MTKIYIYVYETGCLFVLVQEIQKLVKVNCNFIFIFKVNKQDIDF